jgi:hypothetical protein
MILTITSILFILLALNFGLLFLSRIKVKKIEKKVSKPRVIERTITTAITTEEMPVQLAPTGS